MDMVKNGGRGRTVLMKACDKGHHELARALIDAGADLELTDRDGWNALVFAAVSPTWDRIIREFEDEGGLNDEDDDELEERYVRRMQRKCERRLEERRQGRAWCVQALLEAMAPIRAADFPDRAASFKVACTRLQVLGEVVATSHVIEHASSVLVKERVLTLTADAQGIIVDLARAVLAS